MTDTIPGPFRTVADIRAANEAAGHYYFTPDTMRFFGSRVLSGVIAGRYFVTSERQPASYYPQYFPAGERRYTVRVAHDDGTIDTVGEFQGWSTARQARAHARFVAVTPAAV
jgi:hypothetical protein